MNINSPHPISFGCDLHHLHGISLNRNNHPFFSLSSSLPFATLAIAAMAATDGNLPMSTIIHMITTIRLSSSNYLLWRNQLLPLLSYQKLKDHVLGTTEPPKATITTDDKSIPNLEFVSWSDADQRAVLILLSSLSEEATAEVLTSLLPMPFGLLSMRI